MRALVTGANGFLGTWLTRKIAARGDAARVLVRASADQWGLKDLDVERCEGDVTDPASLERAVQGVDVVFHLAGIRRAPSKEIFDRVNAQGTRNVCEAAVRAGCRRFVLAGSLAASGPSTPERPKVEADPFAPYEWYGQSKAEAERIAFEYSGRMEIVSARPSRVLGPGDRENLTFFRIVRKGFAVVVGGPERPISLVDVDDVVDAMLLMADHPRAPGQAFFVSAAEVTTAEKLQGMIAAELGVTPRRLLIPPSVLFGVGAVCDAISKASGKHLPVNRKLARQLIAPAWTVSIEKAQSVLGYQPRVSLAESIRRSTAWYREHGFV